MIQKHLLLLLLYCHNTLLNVDIVRLNNINNENKNINIKILMNEKQKLNVLNRRVYEYVSTPPIPNNKTFDLNAHERIWIECIYNNLSKCVIKTKNEAEEIVNLIGTSISMLVYFDNPVLIKFFNIKIPIILSKLLPFVTNNYNIEALIPTNYYNHFMIHLKNTIFKMNDIANIVPENNQAQFLISNISVFIFSLSCSTTFDLNEQVNSKAVTKYLLLLVILKVEEIKIFATIKNILNTAKLILNKNILMSVQYESILSYKIIRRYEQYDNKANVLKLIDAFLKVKLNISYDSRDFVAIVDCYVENATWRQPIINYFSFNSEKEVLKFLITGLFKENIDDNYHMRYQLIQNLNSKPIEPCILEIFNLYTTVVDIPNLLIYHIENYIKKPNDKSELCALNIANFLIHLLIEPHFFTLKQTPMQENVLLNSYFAFNNGLYTENRARIFGNWNLRRIILKLIKVEDLYIMDLRRLYFSIMELNVYFSTMIIKLNSMINNVRNNSIALSLCFHAYSLQIIARDRLKALNLLPDDYIDHFNPVFVSLLYDFIIDHHDRKWAALTKDCLDKYYLEAGFANSIFKNDDKINCICEMRMIIKKRQYFRCIQLDLSGKYLFFNSIYQLDKYIVKHNGFLPLVYIYVFDGSIVKGKGVIYNWIQNIADIIVSMKKHFFYESMDHKFVPHVLTDNALAKQTIYFKFVGRMIGISLRENCLFPIVFDDFIYDFLLGNYESNAFFNIFIENEYKNRFKFIHMILNGMDNESSNEDPFLITGIDYINGKYTEKDILLIDTPFPYKTSGCDFTFYKNLFISKFRQRILSCIAIVKEGLLQVISKYMLSSIDGLDKFKLMICGEFFIDVEAWKSLTLHVSNVKIIKNTVNLFWEYISMSDQNHRRLILKVWTGFSCLPKIEPKKKNLFEIYVGTLNSKLPFASVCDKTLHLPYCSDLNEMKNYIVNTLADNNGTSFDSI
ncbi:E3 ubiquitin-protein ligase HACE1 [Astathelohania contejeani]|uniref:E3 ubiquitin-protein ligase HACE1 n=1 Tax=Astathelohania contejeani TaxID=164912 RepID=A0ABQ7HY62_9MICR|nr:E3 ubiquitin-protein ligase HACE1 [Thelohania contejeani]